MNQFSHLHKWSWDAIGSVCQGEYSLIYRCMAHVERLVIQHVSEWPIDKNHQVKNWTVFGELATNCSWGSLSPSWRVKAFDIAKELIRKKFTPDIFLPFQTSLFPSPMQSIGCHQTEHLVLVNTPYSHFQLY